MKRTLFLRLALASVAAASFACADSGTGPDDVGSVDELASRLASAGLTVTRSGTIEQPFMSVRGEILASGQHQIQVFDFGTPASASAVVATISADGSSVGTTMIAWVAPPHFYRSGSLIVLYVGSEPAVLAALAQAAGPQFAGR